MAINGTNNADFFNGTRFSEEYYGLGGDDRIRGSVGADYLDGGTGIDLVDYSINFPGPLSNAREGRAVNVDLQRSTQQGDLAEGDTLVSIENVNGTAENDEIRGDGVNNVLFGNGGSDVLEGRGGDDTLFGDGSAPTLLGPAGNDVLDGGAGNDELFGDGGDDTLIGGSGNNLLDGGAGSDTASYAASASAVVVALTMGNSSGVALHVGLPNADQLVSIENVIGSNFADSIAGSSADNVIDGGGGNDLLSGRGGADTLRGGGGIDTATYASSAAGVTVSLGTFSIVTTPIGTFTVETALGTGAGGDAQGDTLSGIENLIGSNFADTLTGNNLANRIEGGAGDDVISADAGNDILVGGSDVDIERLSGGAGFDTFVYLDRSDSNISAARTGDFILDFNVDQDLIDLRALGVNAANLLIDNRVENGVHIATVLEDLNGNGFAEENELFINLIVESAADLTLADILV